MNSDFIPNNTILVVEDEPAIRQMIRFNLVRAGFDVHEAGTSRDAREYIRVARPRLLLVDWMLPDSNGLELTRSLKRDLQYQSLPIIMLTAKSQEQDKIAGLDGGADDYVTKPFSPRELISRINAVLRRTEDSDAATNVIAVGDLKMDKTSHRVFANGQEIRLGPTEFRLLEHFLSHPERVYSRSHLLDRVWGNNVYVEERTVDVHVRRLRKALEPAGCSTMIQTVRGAGYRMSKSNQLSPR